MVADATSSGLFPQIPLEGVERIVRRTLVSAAVVDIFGAAIAVLLGHPLIAPGLVVGWLLAVANHRVFQTSAMRFISPEGTVSRKPFAGTVFLRLGLITAVTAALLVWVRPVGWGVIAALATFQFVMLLNAVVSLVRLQRTPIGDGGSGSA